jgi:ribosome-binding protein aMBF1 (putative translation factor)
MSAASLAPIFEELEEHVPAIDAESDGLNNKDFAKKVRRHDSTISRWRSGKVKIPDDIAREWEIRGDKWYRKG